MFAFFRSSYNESDGTLYNKLIEAIKSRSSSINSKNEK